MTLGCVWFETQDLVKVHKSLLKDVQDSLSHHNAGNLFQIFIDYKERSEVTEVFRHHMYK